MRSPNSRPLCFRSTDMKASETALHLGLGVGGPILSLKPTHHKDKKLRPTVIVAPTAKDSVTLFFRAEPESFLFDLALPDISPLKL